MYSGLCEVSQIPRPNGLGIWLPVRINKHEVLIKFCAKKAYFLVWLWECICMECGWCGSGGGSQLPPYKPYLHLLQTVWACHDQTHHGPCCSAQHTAPTTARVQKHALMWNTTCRVPAWPDKYIGRTVPLLKPPQNPHCFLGAVDHAKKIPPTPGHTASLVLLRLSGHLDSIVLKPFDLAQVCQGNKNLLKTCVDLETDIIIDNPSTLHIELKVEWYF